MFIKMQFNISGAAPSIAADCLEINFNSFGQDKMESRPIIIIAAHLRA